MIIDGKAIAKEILEKTKHDASMLGSVPTFAAITVSPSPATESYLRIKRKQAAEAGIDMEVIAMDATTTEELVERIGVLPHDAVIVQLPLPAHIDLEQVLAAIPPGKDADTLSASTREEGALMHPIARAVAEIFERTGVNPKGAQAVVIGNGWLVGQPVSVWLASVGAHVTILTRESGDIGPSCRAADIIVAGAGSPGLVKPEDVQAGAVVIDVGTSELGGSLAGDVAPGVAEVAGVFTPVPGGVGPIAVACLMRNVVELASLQRASKAV